MAYQTGTFTTAAGLLGSLSSFASANGWTIDDAVASNKFALHKGTTYVSFRYNASDTTGNQVVSIHQATGHTGAALPGAHPNDSGSGYNTNSSVVGTDLDNERHVDLGLAAGELPSTYYFFEQDSSPAYIHVVIAKADGQHRHFGFGELNKFGTWTGGEYCYGHAIGSNPADVVYGTGDTCVLLDGRVASFSSGLNITHLATVHVEGFAEEGASSKWGEVCAAKTATSGTDTAGNARMKIQGGFRGGPLMASLGNIGLNRISGFHNLLPIQLFAYFNLATDRAYYMGEMADVRGIILNGIAAAEEITVGSETWVCFPATKKSQVIGSQLSLYQGIAYRKETA